MLEYTYDLAGNIKAHKVYAMNENGTVATEAAQETYFAHGNTNWPDRLTKYNGQSLTYDNSGNPLTYRDGTNPESLSRYFDAHKGL